MNELSIQKPHKGGRGLMPVVNPFMPVASKTSLTTFCHILEDQSIFFKKYLKKKC